MFQSTRNWRNVRRFLNRSRWGTRCLPPCPSSGSSSSPTTPTVTSQRSSTTRTTATTMRYVEGVRVLYIVHAARGRGVGGGLSTTHYYHYFWQLFNSQWLLLPPAASPEWHPEPLQFPSRTLPAPPAPTLPTPRYCTGAWNTWSRVCSNWLPRWRETCWCCASLSVWVPTLYCGAGGGQSQQVPLGAVPHLAQQEEYTC